MSNLPSKPAPLTLLEVFKSNPERARWLLEYHELVMRGPSPLTVAERELIFAYGSGVNECGYCHGAHKFTAAAFGIPEGLFVDLLADVDGAEVDPKMKPILKFVRKLIETPARITKADADAIYAAGWDERAFLDVVTITALHNYMNRLVDGCGVAAGEDILREAAGRLSTISYGGTAKRLFGGDAAAD